MPGLLEMFEAAPADRQVGSVALWQASLRAETFDEAAGEVDLVIYSGSPVDRWSWEDGIYQLTLALDGADIERLNIGGPVLDSHRRGSLSDQIGAFVPGSVRLEKVGFVGRMRFSSRPEVDWIKADVAAGIIRGVSVGANIHEVEETRVDGRLVSVVATRWEAVEASLLSVQADRKSRTLSMFEADGRQPAPQETPMSTAAQPATDLAAPAVPSAEQLAALELAAAKREQTRQSDIKLLATKLGLDPAGAETHECLSNVAVDLGVARERLIEARHKQELATRVNPHFEVGHEDIEHFGKAAVKAMQQLAFPGTVDLSGDDRARRMGARDFISFAEQCLIQSGVRTAHMSRLEIAERAMSMRSDNTVGFSVSTSDIPALVGSYTRTIVVEGAKAENRNFEDFSVKQNLPNFLKGQALVYSGGPRMEKVAEGAPYTGGSVALRNEEYWLSKWGKLLPFTLELMLQSNGFVEFARMVRMFGVESVRLEKDVVWGIFAANPLMKDGFALFSTQHGNIVTTGKVPGTAGFDDLDQLFGAQTDDAGGNMSLSMQTIAGPRSLRTALKQASGQVVGVMPATLANALPDDMANYKLIIENRLAAQVYYGFASKESAPAIVYGYLDGTEGVDVAEKVSFETDALIYRGRHIFGAKALDWRAVAKNPGASS